MKENSVEFGGRLITVLEILKQGSIKAEAKAAATLNRVKQSMRINYFDDQDYLDEQTQKYSAE